MNNIKQLSSLLMFAEVAKQRSFTLAAKQLGISKSGISQQIKRLEQDLGQQLLSRHTRAMSLTAVGEKLLSRCELLRDQVDLAFEALDHSKQTPSGRFSLTIPHAFEKEIAIPALSQLCSEFPQIEPQILVTDDEKDLIQNNLDVAIYGGALKDSLYRALAIGKVSEIFCATPTYIQQYGLPDTTTALDKHRIISTAWQKNTLTLYDNDMQAEQVFVDVKYCAKTNTLPSALEMTLHHMGIALLPAFVIQPAISSGRLVRVLPKHQGWQWPFYMVHRFHGEKPIHVTRFYQLVKHFFLKANTLI